MENTKSENNNTQNLPTWLDGIYQEVDGFYYYNQQNGASYAAHTLREIADHLDKLNKPWLNKIETELSMANDQAHL